MIAKLKIIFSTITFCIVLSSSLFAQRQSTPEQRAQIWTDWMKKELLLKDVQIAAVHAINLKYAQKNETIKNKDESRQAKFSELKDQDKLKDEDLKSLLTTDQFKQYQAKKEAKQKELLQKALSHK